MQTDKNGIEKDGQEDMEHTFVSLDDDDLDFSEADEKIAIIEGYEYYLSESFPVCIKIIEAIGEHPILEPVLTDLIRGISMAANQGLTKHQILKHALWVLEKALEKEEAAEGECIADDDRTETTSPLSRP